MYAIKGSWVGQTFALATAGDSGGRKTRIRRSKEERKSMVETFIRRYQSSNNGNFPSLNLTHKEVGGSFYTVREIVREIIQENRVLGPARFSPELLGHDNVDKQYPLGSIASDIQDPLFHTENEHNGVPDHKERRIMELTVDTKECYIDHQDINSFSLASEDQTDEIGKDLDDHGCSKSSSKVVVLSEHEDSNSSDLLLNRTGQCFDDAETSIGSITDVSQINGLVDETNELQVAGSSISASLVADEESALNGAYEAQVSRLTEEVIVETFPVRTENDETDDLSRLSTDNENVNGTLNDFEMKPIDSTTDRPYLDTISSSVDYINHVTTNGTSVSQLSVSGRCPNIESSHLQLNDEISQPKEHTLINEASDFIETPETIEGTSGFQENMDHISSHSAVTLKPTEQPNHQSKNASKGMTNMEDGSSNSNDKEAPSLAITNKENKRDGKVVSASSPPVDRINLKSWERAALKRQPNPLLAIVKAFADALIKFWS
ncbi:hypothetical protein vseg_016150 [Gypsophila vaccaria]